MSHHSMAAGMILNLLRPHGLQILAEGLNLFRLPAPPDFEGKRLNECRIRSMNGCNLVAVNSGGRMYINPEPGYRFSSEDELFLVGSDEAQRSYVKTFCGS